MAKLEGVDYKIEPHFLLIPWRFMIQDDLAVFLVV